MEKLNDSTSKGRPSPETAREKAENSTDNQETGSNKTHDKSVYQIAPTKIEESRSTDEASDQTTHRGDSDNTQVKTPKGSKNDTPGRLKTPRQDADDSKSTPNRDGDVGTSGVRTRSQTKKTVSLADDVKLDAEFKKLNLESTPKAADALMTKGTPARPNSARTRSHRQTVQS